MQTNRHIPGVLAAIADLALPHRLIEAGTAEDRDLTEWTGRMFPWGFSQVDWSRVPGHTRIDYSNLEDLVVAFGRMIESLNKSTPVIVMWNNAIYPMLEMQLGNVRLIAREIFEENETSTDVWIFNRAESWLIEMHHEGTLCIGPAHAAIH